MRYLTLLTFLACAAPDSTVSQGDRLSTSSHAIVDNVITLDADALIEDDAIILSDNSRSRIQPGDFVVSDRDNGVLRQVESVDGNRLLTKSAQLTDVIIDTSIHEHFALDPIAV